MAKWHVYGIWLFLLLLVLGQKMWKEISLSPHSLVEATHAHKEHLTGTGVTIAVLDEGFDSSHKTLKNQFSPYRYNTQSRSRDVSEPLTFENGYYKFENHGTHVTGIIASLAPKATIIPIKLGGGGGDQAFVKALNIAASTKAQVVNISLRLSHTGRELSPNVRKALIHLAQSEKIIVIAAGNESLPLLSSLYTQSLVELSLDPQIKGRLLLAGASAYKNGKETLAEFSNYPGSSPLGSTQAYFITAPGESITSTITGGLFGEKSGTSMASPMVAGAIGLLREAFPHLSSTDLVHLLLQSARKVSLEGKPLPRTLFGAGIVNIRSALEQGKSL